MILYHGSNVQVIQPEVIKSNRSLDFGTAFYMTSDYEQAKKWAKLTSERKKQGVPTVNEFEFTDTVLSEISVLHFTETSTEWLKLISACRTQHENASEYDLIIGPVANDRTIDVISLYLIGVYDEDEAIRRLLAFKLTDQYAFKSEKALDYLKYRRSIYV